MNTFEKIKQIIVDHTGTPAEKVVPEADLDADLYLDSLDKVEVVMVVEVEFDCEISDEALEAIATVQDAVSAVDKATEAA